MKKLNTILAIVALSATVTACGGSSVPDVSELEKISPDQLVTVEAVSTITDIDMKVDENGVTTDGNASSVTYISDPAYSGDPVTIRIEQLSESLTPKQVWDDYENSRIYRGDMEFNNENFSYHPAKGKPTNSEFIADAVIYIKNNY